jgi:lysyl-tRNA synthetase class II
MHQINKRLILSLGAMLVVCGASLSGGTVLAEHGSNSGSGSSGSSENETEESTTSSSTSTDTESETEVETQHVDTLKQQFRTQAKAKVDSEVKAKAHTKTHEQKQQACDTRKTNLTKRMSNSVAAAERHKAVFDKIYTRVQDFYTTKKLNVTNYDTLKASVDTAQQDAADQITALKALDVTVDCTQTDSLATNISAFQAAVKSTRDSLKTYRKAIVDLITQIHGASTSTDKTTDTTTDDSSTNSTTTQ